LKNIILAFLCIFFSSLSIFADTLEVLTKDSELLSSPDSKSFRDSLSRVAWPFKIKKEKIDYILSEFIEKFQSGKNDDFEISWSVYESQRKPFFLSFPGAIEYFQSQNKMPVFLSAIQLNKKVVAFFAVTFLISKAGGHEAIIEYIMSPNSGGIGEKILLLLKGEFTTAFNLSKLYAEMEWRGREYWARPLFNFTLSDLQPIVCLNGCEIKFEDLIKRNF
jgi:hypothetical protein